MSTDHPSIRQLNTYRCAGGNFPILVIDTTIADLAQLHGMRVQSWDEPGLGEQRGFIFATASGAVFLGYECVLRLDLGVTVEADGADITRIGTRALEAQAEDVLCSDSARATWRRSAVVASDKWLA